MSLSIEDYELPYDTHNLYDVNFFSDKIHTLVTHTPSGAPTTATTTTPSPPSSSASAAAASSSSSSTPLSFRNQSSPSSSPTLYTFVGVGVDSDVEKLTDDYGISVATTVDLRSLAAAEYGVRELRNAGLKDLAMQVLGKEVVKPRWITMSRWDNEYLSASQVQYACVDAFLSFEIGRCLNAAGQ
ncbi:hypothetical protein Acr_00g0014410 [Actinidia rufa]|uniref:3'-5' exonuclease domain-containing protein n=1 Tax=Actinidia rufa TaxID=165716 RepID=A0A7J0DAB6_9ERIC|nr:hypothetical protein Acr_00g0014410 [Actinidia rufa]